MGQRRMYQGSLLDDQRPAPRVRLVRCADGERVDITDALAAERERLAAADREWHAAQKTIQRREAIAGVAALCIAVALVGGALGVIASLVLP